MPENRNFDVQVALMPADKPSPDQLWPLFDAYPVPMGLVSVTTLTWDRVNAAFEAFAERPSSALVGEPLLDGIHRRYHDEVVAAVDAIRLARRNVERIELQFRRPDGSTVDARLILTGVNDVLLVVAENLSQREHPTIIGERDARDPLTTLPWHPLIHERLSQLTGRPFTAVAVVDLDNFALANDTRGYSWGDRLLVAASERLRSAVRDTDHLARLGADEFVVLFDPVRPGDEAVMAQRIVVAFREPLRVGSTALSVTVSVGVATGVPGDDPDELVRRAAAAAREAKRAGKDQWRLYDPATDATPTQRARRLTRIREAVSNDEFRFLYQPIRTLADGQLIGVEALARWHHPDGTLDPAIDFVDTVAGLGLLSDMTQNLLARLRDDAPLLAERGVQSVAVNITPELLVDTAVCDSLVSVVRDGHVRQMVVELSEVSAGCLSERASDALLALRSEGVHVCVDDFGAGRAALEVVTSLAPDIVKIHQLLVRGLGQPAGRAMIRSLVVLCEELSIDLVGLGVESVPDLAALRSMGVTFGQGRELGVPAPADKLVATLRLS